MIGWKKLVNEIPEDEQDKKREEHVAQWKEGESRDGYVVTGQQSFTHCGITFQLKILRYFTFDNGFTPMSFHITDKHVVVEYPEPTRPLADMVRELFLCTDFLWHDTQQTPWNKSSLQEQLEAMYNSAIRDIETLPNMIAERMTKLKELSETLTKLKEA